MRQKQRTSSKKLDNEGFHLNTITSLSAGAQFTYCVLRDSEMAHSFGIFQELATDIATLVALTHCHAYD
jgi:hypothetical protein